ncbi:tryptophan 7-halogenase [Alkalimonas collagenimarina]|uniref:Tryptophan 7-halogenase n=1 Tax=Alkalimonas collagenimarina TaxID=400390 RepID=A0ABT9H3M9_9GAMM|nr:tryptophan halogenase family protein [Alkalimonas collagenimarina]MDP4537916.1 tryptophan 7-halogenase [Alkalimonas collagenimarina]
MTSHRIQKLVIVGGGTAGWISASLLMKMLGKAIQITLVESEDIGIVGVGEATIPPIMNFNMALGIDETEFLRETKGSIKLGIQFENWGQLGDSYMHAFGTIGKEFPSCSFHHFWLRSQQAGMGFDFWDFSLAYQAAKKNKFAKLGRIEGVNLPGLSYAYHFDAGLYARYLRRYSENLGVKRIEGKVEQVQLNPDNGDVQSLQLENGQQVQGDLFLDCTGLHSLLIEKTLNTGFEDWSHWLPADSAMAVPCESVQPVTPYTRSIAHAKGWQWRIPLQHRIGNGFVYSSKYCSDEEARATLMNNLDGAALAEPRIIRFKTGRRLKQWNRNVISIGLSSGFLEPLESTSIHLIQSGVLRLLKFFPNHGICPVERDEYNRQSKIEFEQIRDFVILHYKLNQRGDSQYWKDCQRMEIPESLQRKIAVFANSGRVFREQDELFAEVAWQQVLIGQGMIPDDYHPLVNALTEPQLQELLEQLKAIMTMTSDKLGSHDAFLRTVSN